MDFCGFGQRERENETQSERGNRSVYSILLRWKRTIKHCAPNLIYRFASSSAGNMYHRKAVFCIGIASHCIDSSILILIAHFAYWIATCEQADRIEIKRARARGSEKSRQTMQNVWAQCLTWFGQSHSIPFLLFPLVSRSVLAGAAVNVGHLFFSFN